MTTVQQQRNVFEGMHFFIHVQVCERGWQAHFSASANVVVAPPSRRAQGALTNLEQSRSWRLSRLEHQERGRIGLLAAISLPPYTQLGLHCSRRLVQLHCSSCVCFQSRQSWVLRPCCRHPDVPRMFSIANSALHRLVRPSEANLDNRLGQQLLTTVTVDGASFSFLSRSFCEAVSHLLWPVRR